MVIVIEMNIGILDTKVERVEIILIEESLSDLNNFFFLFF